MLPGPYADYRLDYWSIYQLDQSILKNITLMDKSIVVIMRVDPRFLLHFYMLELGLQL